jgi:hypothetical protein
LADQQAAAEKARVESAKQSEQFAAARAQERAAWNGRFDNEEKSLATCTEHNARLVEVGHELLVRVRQKGFLDIVKQEEPLLGLGDVEMFNLIQAYRDKIDAERLPPDATKNQATPQ